MKQNWIPTLLFSIAFGAIGFILGRITCCPPHHPPGAKCCKEEKCASSSEETQVIIHSMDDDQKLVEEIMLKFEDSDFEGDTTIMIPNGTVQITKSNDREMNVSVNMEKEIESTKTLENGQTEKRIEKRIMKMESDER